jgi:hypothetical protein
MNLVLYIIKPNATKTYVEVQFHAFLTLEIDAGGQLHAPAVIFPVRTGPHSRSGHWRTEELLDPTGNRGSILRSCSPYPGHYITWFILALFARPVKCKFVPVLS